MLAIAESFQESLQRFFAEPFSIGEGYPQQKFELCVIGNPPTLPRYPSICVEVDDNVNAGIAIGVFNQEHHLTITVWTNAATYEQAYRTRLVMAQKIETSLFRNVYPIIKPYCWSFLQRNVTVGDKVIYLADSTPFWTYPYHEQLLPVYLDDGRVRYPNSIIDALDENSYLLERPVPIDIYANDTSMVIRPLVHTFNCMVDGIEYGTGQQENLPLLHATIRYTVNIARLRYSEPYQTAQ